MNKITTQDGQEYEVVIENEIDCLSGNGKYTQFVTKPIKQEKNWSVWINESSVDNYIIETEVRNTPKTQAQAISEVIKALMEYVFSEPGTSVSFFSEVPIVVSVRDAIRGDS